MQTIKELAVSLDVTPQAVYKAKTKAEKAYGKIEGIVDLKDNRVVRYSAEDCRKILEFANSKASETSDNGCSTVVESVDVPLSETAIERQFRQDRAEIERLKQEDLPDVTVEVGNHQIVRSTPDLPESYSLESLRTTESVQIEDPLAAAAHFLAIADHLTTKMRSDLQVRQAKLNQTQQATEAIKAKRQQLELEARIYQLETSRLDTAQTATTQQLQTDLASLQSLGKPVATGSDGSQ